MKITKITQQKKDPQRVSVFIDGKFAFGLSQEELAACGLVENAELSSALLNSIKTGIVFRRAKSVALRYINRRMRSEKEVREKLRSYEDFDSATIDAVIKALCQYGIIDDLHYAQQFCLSRANALDGPIKLKQKLWEKGIAYDPSLCQGSADSSAPSEADNALALLKRRLSRRPPQGTSLSFDEKKKLTQYLRSKGYTPSAITAAFRQLTHDTNDIFTEWDEMDDYN